MKALYDGDNLQVLRDSIATESVELIHLDPPFNSNATYNVGLPGESGRDRMRGRTAGCSQEQTLGAQNRPPLFAFPSNDDGSTLQPMLNGA